MAKDGDKYNRAISKGLFCNQDLVCVNAYLCDLGITVICKADELLGIPQELIDYMPPQVLYDGLCLATPVSIEDRTLYIHVIKLHLFVYLVNYAHN